jgi:uncharacterized protein YdhG (YjbR/CyaY superfamily)
MSPTKSTFSAEEKAAMKERAKEARTSKNREDGERDVLAKIAAMQPSDRAIGERIHALIKAAAPELVPRTWYGMPAYTKDDKVVCYFRDAYKFKERYAMFGFNEKANLDDGEMWPVAYAIKSLTAADEAKLGALVKQAAS